MITLVTAPSTFQPKTVLSLSECSHFTRLGAIFGVCRDTTLREQKTCFALVDRPDHAAGGAVRTSSNPSFCSKGRNTENAVPLMPGPVRLDRKSTSLNSTH